MFTPELFATITLFITNSKKLLEKRRAVDSTRIVLKARGIWRVRWCRWFDREVTY
jgi:hypothetical protein